MAVAVITGAASGIGAGLAREAARRGFHVILADRDEAALSAVVQAIGDTAIAAPIDVTDPRAVDALAERAFDQHGHVDLLFNNAGIMTTGRCWEISADAWRASWQVNVEAIVNGLRAFVPPMIAADRSARIINTASVGGFMPSPLMAPYTASKFAVVALTEALAGELKMLRTKIQVSLLVPGPVKSQIFRSAPPAAAASFHKQMTELLADDGMAADDFAALVFEAVGRNEYWIIPQPEAFDPGFVARNEIILNRSSPHFYGLEES